MLGCMSPTLSSLCCKTALPDTTAWWVLSLLGGSRDGVQQPLYAVTGQSILQVCAEWQG